MNDAKLLVDSNNPDLVKESFKSLRQAQKGPGICGDSDSFLLEPRALNAAHRTVIHWFSAYRCSRSVKFGDSKSTSFSDDSGGYLRGYLRGFYLRQPL
jgi:hypothetical protein